MRTTKRAHSQGISTLGRLPDIINTWSISRFPILPRSSFLFPTTSFTQTQTTSPYSATEPTSPSLTPFHHILSSLSHHLLSSITHLPPSYISFPLHTLFQSDIPFTFTSPWFLSKDNAQGRHALKHHLFCCSLTNLFLRAFSCPSTNQAHAFDCRLGKPELKETW